MGPLGRFLIQGQADIPAPVDEDGKRKACRERGKGTDGERIEPIPGKRQGRRITPSLPSGYGIPGEHHDLQDDERVLHRLRRIRPAVANTNRRAHEDKTGPYVDY